MLTTDNNQNFNQDLINALARNRELIERVYESTEKTRRYIFWIYILSILKIVLIVLPIIILLVFLLPMLKDVIDLYTGGALGGDIF